MVLVNDCRSDVSPVNISASGAKFVGKISSQTESKYVFLNLHILYNGTIHG